MNIFKVIASAPMERFNENFTSAILAWLLNPYMEHGIGYTFLIKFLKKIGIEEGIIDKLNTSISDDNDYIDVDVLLECSVNHARIDIVLVIDNYYHITIENKILSESASDEEQLIKQFDGINIFMKTKEEKKEMINKPKLKMVFLVPDKEDQKVKKVSDCLKEAKNICPEIITWNDISEIILEILDGEQKCGVSPINEYTRHTLKAFTVFIKDGFKGYNAPKQKNSQVPDRRLLKYEKVFKDPSIQYVGMPHGLKGIKGWDLDKILDYDFHCTWGTLCPLQWEPREELIEFVEGRKKSVTKDDKI